MGHCAHAHRHFAGGTLHFCAAARSSISRAVAPAWCIAATKSRTEQDPSVFCDPYFVIADGLLHPNGLPIDVELVGDDERQRCPAACSHLRAVRRDHDLAVRLKAEVHARLPGGVAAVASSAGRFAPSTSAPAEKTVPRKPRRSRETTSTRHSLPEPLVRLACQAADLGHVLGAARMAAAAGRC